MLIIALDTEYCYAGSRLRLSVAKQFLVNVIMVYRGTKQTKYKTVVLL